MQQAVLVSIQTGEVLNEAAFTADELARACGVATGWVCERVEAGILQRAVASGETLEAWRFDSVTLLRARRILQLETIFAADPQLAALTTDLIEELASLRQQLRALNRQDSHLS